MVASVDGLTVLAFLEESGAVRATLGTPLMADFTVRLFASAREQAGRDSLRVTLAEGGTVNHLRARLEQAEPGLAPLLSRCAIAVNRRYARDDQKLRAGDEIAIIPPVAGG